jgi:hypothetical protein
MNSKNPAYITLEDRNGKTYDCQLIDLIECQDTVYGLLLRRAEADTLQGLVVMRLHERDGQPIFQTIESDAEFARVTAYIEALTSVAASGSD